jgi:uncharacterized membrane protein HdeD (DUF308 family)
LASRKEEVIVATAIPALPRELTRNWFLFVLRGAVAVLFGLGAWAWPDLTLAVLIALFGAYALVDGVFAVAAGLAHRGEDRRWWAELLVGVAGIAVGVLTFAWPGATALTLLYLIASWALVSGVMEIAAAIELRRAIDNEWLLGLGGAASVLFGLLLFVNPGSGALSVIWLIGAYAVLFGALLIALGLRLRAMRGATGIGVDRRGETGARPTG